MKFLAFPSSTTFPVKHQHGLERVISERPAMRGTLFLTRFSDATTVLVAAEKLGREWVGIDVSQQASVEIKERMIKLAIDRGENELAIWKGTQTRDLRKSVASLYRDEWGKLPPTRTHRKWMYGEQGGHCKGCENHFEMRNLEVDHYVPKSKGGTDQS